MGMSTAMAGVPVGSSVGMYPAIEITCTSIAFVQVSDSVRPPLRPRFGPSTYGTNLPPIEHPGKGAGRGVAIAGTADESRRCQNLRRGHYELAVEGTCHAAGRRSVHRTRPGDLTHFLAQLSVPSDRATPSIL